MTDKDKFQFDHSLVKMMIGHTKDGGFAGGRIASCNFQGDLLFTYKDLLKWAEYAIRDGLADCVDDVELYITTKTGPTETLQ